MNLSQCRAFVAVAEAGSFTAAARRIGVSQSAVSHAVAALEKEIGAELLLREPGGVALTDAGERVLRSARSILVHAQEIATVATRTHGSAVPRLRLGVNRSFARRLLPQLLAELRLRQHEIALDVRMGPCEQIEQWLRQGQVDVGVTTLRPDTPGHDGLSARAVLRDTLRAVLPVGHPLGLGPALHVRQLENQSVLLPGESAQRRFAALLQRHGVTPRAVLNVDDPGTLLALAAHGHGVTLLPGVAVPAELPRLRALPLVPAVPCPQYVVPGDTAEPHPRAELLVRLLKDLAEQRDWPGPGQAATRVATAAADVVTPAADVVAPAAVRLDGACL